MTWSVHHAQGCAYVEGVLEGTTSWQDMKDLTARCIALQRQHGITRFLIETSAMLATATIADVFELPASEYPEQNVDRRTRIAVVYSPCGTSGDLVTFYETACTNRGWRARSFTGRQQAIDWLLGGTANIRPR